MTAGGVIPAPEERAPWCDAKDPTTGTFCDLRAGHADKHQATIDLAWRNDADDPALD
jgi:hypothetical protein